ncbi:hypothetical protein BDZ97DRAFT_1913589 [Flammula alnicola]|nr:hypothetical protein BDZ97DRAFT_1913589 [Flammula alnicola]
MPTFCLTVNNFFASGSFYIASLMPQKTIDETTNEPPTAHLKNADERASILVFFSAQAIGSIGFAVSIFAIWFTWLLPASITTPTPTEVTEIKKPRSPHRHPRRPSAHVALPIPNRRASAPFDLAPILASHPEDDNTHPRHVYFADSPISPITRRNTMPAGLSDTHVTLGNLTTSPLATISALTQDGTEESLPDSDSSPHSSKTSLTRPSSRLQKLKLFNVKVSRPESLEKPGDQASIASTETNSSEKSARRASGGFVASWTLSRNRTAPDMTAELSSPSPSRLSFARRMSPSRPPTSPAPVTPGTTHASDILSPTFLTRKNQKRVSAPIPRTSPYGAPYFASPPMLLDNNYHSYLKTLPQFEDEIQGASSQASDSDDTERGRGRTPSIRRVSLNPPRRIIHKQRSASEDWTPRPETHS